MRVWAVSDIHTDYKENLEWCQQLSDDDYKQDVLILAGDVTDNLDTLRATFECLASKWKCVFFTPGNHDLWVRRQERGQYDSIGKLERVQQVCKECGVLCAPKCIDGVWIVPILSWYHATFDREPDIPGAADVEKVMVDFQVCNWPRPDMSARDTSVAAYVDALNEPMLGNLETVLEMEASSQSGWPKVITFSHFLPLQELLPEKRMLFQPNLAKACGSDFIQRRIEELKPMAHIFGHTHFSWDASIGGVRYIQWPLAYPQERRRRQNGGQGWLPLLVYDTETGLTEEKRTYWASLYKANGRNPENVQPAPWVGK
ncbi:hypothetical protein WJX72_005803 [[Myrmecia] bisecta]|uniref:Calcineurin-like phosphoesterase domain-containing protein n=1 Tax=[Myrmecia] bisecta TaxID=41462 RepID=A0AAW1PPJ8_9CHLO